MSDQLYRSVWVVFEDDRDDLVDIKAVFESEDDATTFASAMGYLDVEEKRLYAPGHQPALRTVHRASAVVVTRSTRPDATHVAPRLVTSMQVSELDDEWAKLTPCEPGWARTSSRVLITARGTDRDAVLASVTERYEQQLSTRDTRDVNPA